MTNAPPMPAAPPGPPSVAAGSFGAYAGIALLVAVIFWMYGGLTFGQWLLHPSTNPYPATWQEGPRAGQPVSYFELEGGEAWRDLGTFATMVGLLVEAGLYCVAAARPAAARAVLTAVIAVAVAAGAANALSAGMQTKMGFTQPMLAVVGLIVCVLSVVSARQLRA